MPVELKVPAVGESISEVEIGPWLKQPGEPVAKDDVVMEIETDKATFQLAAPVSGAITKVIKQPGQKAAIGEVIAYMEEGAAPAAKKETAAPASKPPAESRPAAAAAAPASPPRVMPAAARLAAERGVSPGEVTPSGPGGRVLKEDVARHVEKPAAPAAGPARADGAVPPAGGRIAHNGERAEGIVPMTPLRRRVAERLVEAQAVAALLTTFNEIDMSAVSALRKQHQDAFEKRYGVRLGLMSFFVKAAIDALRQFPQLNAEIRGTDVAYRNYYDIGVAVSAGKGLVVPVIRNAERLSFAEIEKAIADFGARGRDNKLKLDELQGGTFTISNGGVFGSLLSTPIVNPPQSGILGLHAIQDRPVARDGQVVIRPMMYVALTYDHRIVDGREAVTFLRRIKDCVEEPARMIVEC